MDDVILDKASKHSIEETRRMFEEYADLDTFNEAKDEIWAKISYLQKIAKQLSDKQVDIQEEVSMNTQDIVSQLKTKIKRELFEVNGIRPVDEKEFEAKLQLKASLQDIEHLATLKIDSQDHFLLKDYCMNLKSQLDQVIYVFCNYLKQVEEMPQKQSKFASEFKCQLDTIHQSLKRYNTRFKQKCDNDILASHRRVSSEHPSLSISTIDMRNSRVPRRHKKLNLSLKRSRIYSHIKVNDSARKTRNRHELPEVFESIFSV
ncbi:unnamed protein product [Moneuplotes crassus]|uniref:Uncharacterized protein n=1 Tax=Euplotes crassus TaxID=5936 RepID=A0AAD1XA34_EUPCR|nr:unnamed protein product [Moneuplotes crassus]